MTLELTREETQQLHLKGYLIVKDYVIIYDKGEGTYIFTKLTNDIEVLELNHDSNN